MKIPVIETGNTKVIDFTPWGGIEGFLAATNTGANAGNIVKLRQAVPWFQRALNMTANAVSTLPFIVTNEAGEQVDTSADWKDITGGVPNPKRMIYLVAAALCSGAAYLRIRRTSRTVVDLQYILASTISEIKYSDDGLPEAFIRTNPKGKREPIPADEMIYFWLPDDTVETGPATITPVGNAALAAELVANMDWTLKTYGENGFVSPHAMFVSGMPTKGEAQKAEETWNLFLRMRLGLAKIFNADKSSIVPLGAGMSDMRGSYIQITRQQIENIGAAFGIPASVFMSNAANYATANVDKRTWYEAGVFVLIYQTIQETLTQQLYARFNYKFQFNLAGLDAFQQDEVDKSSAFNAYAQKLPLSLSAELVGLDLPEGMQYADLDTLAQEPAPAPVVPAAQPAQPDPEADALASELMAWQRYAVKRFGKDAREFECKHIPPALALRINAGLQAAKSADDIPGVFADAQREIGAVLLARAISSKVA